MAEGEGMNAPLIVGQAQAQAQPPPYAYPVQQQPAQNYGSAPQQVVYQQPSQQTPQAIVVQPQVAQPQMVQPQVVQPQIMVVPQQIDYTRITGRHSQQALCPRCQQVCLLSIVNCQLFINIQYKYRLFKLN